LDEQTGPLPALAVEDLVARNTAHVCGRLRQGHAIAAKHVRAFTRLLGLGEPAQLADAWRDHRQEVPGTLEGRFSSVKHFITTSICVTRG
jgi:hypothetical protein